MHYLLPLLPAALAQLLLVGYTPGPANIYALSVAVRYGRRRALRVWYGLLCGFTVAASLVAVMGALLGKALGDGVVYIKYVGAAYILFLAYQTAKRKPRSSEDAGEPHGDASATFLSGFIVQLTNAKMLVFDLMFLQMFFLPYSRRFADLAVAVLLLEIAGPGANLVWLLAGGWLRRVYEAHQRGVSLTLAALLALCALWIVVS